ncbi:probable peptide methionine sulfoxide reductase at C-terminar half [Coccomyxa sp. Obi]|nr:probable peptide methionine sulfoxide reductase at C-terminar half [Coccomyxa sp. Obi]
MDMLVMDNVAAPRDYVLVHYKGTLDDGTVFDCSHEREPLGFIVGGGKVIRGFDDAVIGLAKGERRTERVPPENAYGEWRSELTASIPTAQLPEGTSFKAGDSVRLSNGADAVVIESTDEALKLDFNPPMAGKALTFEVELVKLTKASHLQKATFGAGCFWGPELMFQRIPGVVATEVGYSQGHVENPTYEDVCSGDTGHTEAVQVTYDPSLVSYEELLGAFWKQIDPTQVNGQGGDRGTQYRTGIYTHTEEQLHIAEASKSDMAKQLQAPIATEVEAVRSYWTAEEYHQEYLAKGGRFGRAQDPSKGCTDPIRCYG